MGTVTINGLDEVLADLDRLAEVEEYKNDLKKACLLVERSAKQKAPKGVGELRNSITSKIEATEESIVGVIYTPLEYAPYVEYGTGLFAEEQGRLDVPWNYKDDEGNWHSTSGMKPSPYMRPALYENKEQIIRILKGANNSD